MINSILYNFYAVDNFFMFKVAAADLWNPLPVPFKNLCKLFVFLTLIFIKEIGY